MNAIKVDLILTNQEDATLSQSCVDQFASDLADLVSEHDLKTDFSVSAWVRLIANKEAAACMWREFALECAHNAFDGCCSNDDAATPECTPWACPLVTT